MWKINGSAKSLKNVYREVFNAAGDSIFITNHNLEIIDANQACARVFSCTKDMFVPMPFNFLIYDIVDPKVNGGTSVKEILQRDSGDVVHVVAQALDGRKFRAEMRSAAVDPDHDAGYVIYLREVAV